VTVPRLAPQPAPLPEAPRPIAPSPAPTPPPVAPPPAAVSVPVPEPAPLPATDEPPTASHGSARKLIGIVGVAAGGAALVTGGLVAWAAKSQWDEAFAGPSPHCDAMSRCDRAGLDATDGARGKATVATALVAGGALLAAGGALLWLTAPSDAPSVSAAVVPVSGGLGLDVNGRF
jgi:hypothetical protein